MSPETALALLNDLDGKIGALDISDTEVLLKRFAGWAPNMFPHDTDLAKKWYAVVGRAYLKIMVDYIEKIHHVDYEKRLIEVEHFNEMLFACADFIKLDEPRKKTLEALKEKMKEFCKYVPSSIFVLYALGGEDIQPMLAELFGDGGIREYTVHPIWGGVARKCAKILETEADPREMQEA